MSYSVRHNPADPSNYDIGRGGKAIDTIVIHHAASTSFDSIAQTFKNPARDASAHYAVGRNNNVDLMVDERNTAWHCGNYPYNQRSVGIENVNSSGAPNWEVAPETKNTLKELCVDIVRRNPGIGKLVPGKNLFGHKQVSTKPTACPVTLIAFLQELADHVNAVVTGNVPAPTPQPGKKTNDQLADEVMRGEWGNGDDRKNRLRAAGYSYEAVQAIVNGRVGQSPAAPRKSNEVVAAEVLAGAWGNNPERKQRLEAAGYNYQAIQDIVNNKVGGSTPAQPPRSSVEQVADQVIAGAWGNGVDRQARLAAAGYDYGAVQAAVNQKLGIGVAPSRKTNDQIANEVIRGDWGNGPQRRERLAAAGYDYGAVQALVNRKLGL